MNDMDDSPFKVGLRYNERARAAGAQTERRGEAGPVSVLLRGWDSPAALRNRLLLCRTATVLLFLLCAQQLGGLRPEAPQFLILLSVLIHPLHCLIERLAGLFLVA